MSLKEQEIEDTGKDVKFIVCKAIFLHFFLIVIFLNKPITSKDNFSYFSIRLVLSLFMYIHMFSPYKNK